MTASDSNVGPDSQAEGIQSQHVQPGSAEDEPSAEDAPSENRSARDRRPVREANDQGDSAGVAGAPVAHGNRLGEHRVPDADPEALDPETAQIAQIVLQRIQAESHLHLPMQVPDARALEDLRTKDPKAHAMWLRQAERQLEHQRFMESARFAMPLRVMRSAHLSGLIALIAILCFAGYALYLDHPWISAFLAALDVFGVVAIFVNNGPDDE